jgi:hypothetical protein
METTETSSGYRPVSGLAVAALAMGALSALALTSPLLWGLPLLGVCLAVVALRDVSREGAEKAGRAAALAGLALSIGFGAQALAGRLVARRIMADRARAVATAWLDAIRDGKLVEARTMIAPDLLPSTSALDRPLQPHDAPPEPPEAEFARMPVVAALPVGTAFSDHPEGVVPTDWTPAPGRPVLEAVLSIDDIEIRPYTCGFGAMTGVHSSVRPDLPHIGVALMRPRTRGRLTLVSGDPGVPMVIEHRYDSEPEDVAALRRGSDVARELTGAHAGTGPAAWSTSQHLCGTAPMGADGDTRAVVDHRCRVRGFENLWVIDGSILPAITSRGPHATIVMLGHRAAEFVRADNS